MAKAALFDCPGPDTSRYRAAGAAQVEWLQYDSRVFFGGAAEGSEARASLPGSVRRPPLGMAATGARRPSLRTGALIGYPRATSGAAVSVGSPDQVFDEVLGRFPAEMAVITEGTAAVKYARPIAVILVTSSSPREMKPACQAVLSAVTDLVIDGPAEEDSAVINTRLCWTYPDLRPKFVWGADLPRNVLPAAFLERLRRLIGSRDYL